MKALYRARPTRPGSNCATPPTTPSIMAFLVDAISGRYELADVAQRFLGEASDARRPSLFGAASDETLAARGRSRSPDCATCCAPRSSAGSSSASTSEIELPLVRVLGRMEARGIRVDVDLLRTIAEEFANEATALDARDPRGGRPRVQGELAPAAPERCSLTSSASPPGKKIKSGYSTDAASLEAIVDEHPIVPLILRYREVEKLRSTYGAPLIDAVGPDGRIHATFNQIVARTGRLSSENPNLHNIPVRSPEGRRLRYAFVPTEGWLLAVSDYNQIELRILAHLSQDQGLLAAFASHEDVHRTIAASVFGVAPEDVTPEQREQRQGRLLRPRLRHGGLRAQPAARRCRSRRAREIMDKYFEGFPSLREYLDDVVKEIRSQGYSRTEFGRIRPFPDLATAVGPQRQAAERQAMNAGHPGTRGRHLQVRPRAPRPRAAPRRPRGAPHPAGPRRSPRRGAAEREGARRARSSSTR